MIAYITHNEEGVTIQHDGERYLIPFIVLKDDGIDIPTNEYTPLPDPLNYDIVDILKSNKGWGRASIKIMLDQIEPLMHSYKSAFVLYK